jgi:hypothetical protein
MKLSECIEKLEIKIGDEQGEKYDMARLGNYEFDQKILAAIFTVNCNNTCFGIEEEISPIGMIGIMS